MSESFWNDFSEALKEFLDFLGDLLASCFQGLYLMMSTLFGGINDWLSSLNIPILPTKTKILQEAIVSGTLLVLVAGYMLYINIYTFTLFKADKKKSKKAPPKSENGKRRKRPYDRISEKKLFKSCLKGGAFGGYAAMLIYRHKTQKKAFAVLVPILLFIQLLLYSFILGFLIFWLYMS